MKLGILFANVSKYLVVIKAIIKFARAISIFSINGFSVFFARCTDCR